MGMKQNLKSRMVQGDELTSAKDHTPGEEKPPLPSHTYFDLLERELRPSVLSAQEHQNQFPSLSVMLGRSLIRVAKDTNDKRLSFLSLLLQHVHYAAYH